MDARRRGTEFIHIEQNKNPHVAMRQPTVNRSLAVWMLAASIESDSQYFLQPMLICMVAVSA
jgi:hypothetical protein